MRKATWSAAAIVVLLSATGIFFGGPRVQAADGTVAMVEGSSSDPKTWKFNPQDVTVAVGESVTWRNDGKLQHDARTDSQEFSPLLNEGESHKFTFNTPGRYEYYCEPHRSFGMTGVITVTGGSSTPTTAAPTTTTQAAGGSTTTTAANPGETTTTTVKNGAAAGSTTTTTAGAADAGVTTSSAPAVTPPSPGEAAGETTTTTGHGEEAAAADGHASGGTSEDEKSSPIGIAFAGISTLILGGISTKLLASRS